MKSKRRLEMLACLLVIPLLFGLALPALGANAVKTKTTEAAPATADAPAAETPPPRDPAYAAFEDGRYLTALELAKKAAATGEPTAHTLIARLYAEGLGVQRDLKVAAGWYRKAADLGDINAKFALGLMFAKGEGVAKDSAAAAQLFEQAAKGGSVPAKYNLGLLYAAGDGRPQDAVKAAALITEAAKGGEPQARFDLGQMYANGAGVQLDESLAAHWTELTTARPRGVDVSIMGFSSNVTHKTQSASPYADCTHRIPP